MSLTLSFIVATALITRADNVETEAFLGSQYQPAYIRQSLAEMQYHNAKFYGTAAMPRQRWDDAGPTTGIMRSWRDGLSLRKNVDLYVPHASILLVLHLGESDHGYLHQGPVQVSLYGCFKGQAVCVEGASTSGPTL